MTYDTKSLELATHFLSDMLLSAEQRRTYTTRLAQSIQRTVEDELDAIEAEVGIARP